MVAALGAGGVGRRGGAVVVAAGAAVATPSPHGAAVRGEDAAKQGRPREDGEVERETCRDEPRGDAAEHRDRPLIDRRLHLHHAGSHDVMSTGLHRAPRPADRDLGHGVSAAWRGHEAGQGRGIGELLPIGDGKGGQIEWRPRRLPLLTLDQDVPVVGQVEFDVAPAVGGPRPQMCGERAVADIDAPQLLAVAEDEAPVLRRPDGLGAGVSHRGRERDQPRLNQGARDERDAQAAAPEQDGRAMW